VSSHPGFRFRCETADAARVAATKSGGWRSSRTLSCSSKVGLYDPVSVRSVSRNSLHTDDLQAEEAEQRARRSVPAHEMHLADVTDGAGA
jgi:hypothetical protein